MTNHTCNGDYHAGHDCDEYMRIASMQYTIRDILTKNMKTPTQVIGIVKLLCNERADRAPLNALWRMIGRGEINFRSDHLLELVHD